jgi:hypothetical protein
MLRVRSFAVKFVDPCLFWTPRLHSNFSSFQKTMVLTPTTNRFESTYRQLVFSLQFIVYWMVQTGTAAPSGSMDNEIPNASQLYLNGLSRHRCPYLSTVSSFSINQNSTELIPVKEHYYACQYPVQCDVIASPPDVSANLLFPKNIQKAIGHKLCNQLCYLNELNSDATYAKIYLQNFLLLNLPRFTRGHQ